MKNNIFQLQKITLAVIFSLLSFCSVFAQQPETAKIKDGTISNTMTKAKDGAIFELESNNKGMLISRMSKAQRDAIPSANLSNGLLIFNTNTNCFDYWDSLRIQWLSMCGTPPPAVFDITALQCSAIAAQGTYKEGEILNPDSNKLIVPVTVTQPGTYTMAATTANGYYFEASGTFPSANTYDVVLKGTGKPNSGYSIGSEGDAVSLALNGIVNSCTPHIFVEKASVDFTIVCGSIGVEGSYFINTPLVNENRLAIDVNVTSLGFWSMSTKTINGYSFSGNGNFDKLGLTTIYLAGTGAPVVSQTDSFSITSNANTAAGASCTGIAVTVSPVAYTIDCANGTQSGAYLQDVALTNSNKITIPISVTAPGTTTITATGANGISFTSGPVAVDKTTTSIVLSATAGTPTAGGTTSLSVTGTPGAASGCSFNLTVAGQPVAYTMSCSNVKVEGSYVPGIAMNSNNKMTIPVSATYPGDYNISATANGITFSGTGSLPKGASEVVLTATGTPAKGGPFTFTINSNSTSGSTTCTKAITFVYRTMNVLGLGGGLYQPATAGTSEASRAILMSAANFGASGIVMSDPIKIVNGAYNDGTALKNLINNNNIDIIVIGYNFTPNAASITVLNDFVKNKKGVLIHSQENDSSNLTNLFNTICNSSSIAVSGSSSTYVNNILNVSDPLLDGPFGNAKGLALGSDVNNSYYVTGLPADVTVLATNGNNASRAFMFKHNTLGYVYIGDSGWTAGTPTNTSTTTWPAKITSTGLVQSKAYDGGTTVYNSIVYANTIAWAIQYAQANIDSTYRIP